MPAKSAAQKRLMDAAAHNPKFAKRVGIPVGVAKEFSEASKGIKFRAGGRPDLQKINRPKTNHGGSALFKEGGEMKSKKYAMGGMPTQANVGGASRGLDRAAAMSGRAMPATGRPMKKGGSVATSKMGAVKTAAPSRDGVAIKGHTKGTVVKMAGGKGMKKGGKC